jgi:hypothetical protein
MHLTIRIADQPRLMSVSVEPVDLETRAVFLAAPAAAALYVENVHVDTAPGSTARRLENRAPPYAPSGHVVRCSRFSESQTRWAHRLQIYVPRVTIFQQFS